jgi:uroporphyrinogen decarboxylase
MSDRERFLACILGQPVDRPPYWLFWGPWRTTGERWNREGRPKELRDFGFVRKHFGAESPPAVVPVNCGPCPKFERKVWEDTPDHVVFTDGWGIKRRDLKRNESMSEFLAWPVKHRADWERYRKERLDSAHPERLAGDWRRKCAEWVARGIPIQLGYYPDVGIFGSVRWLLGDEQGLAAFIEDPELVHDIMAHMTTLYLAVFAQVVKDVRVDVIHIWEDMCGRQGPLISPQHWDDFLGPCYRRIKRFADANGIPVLSVDTDGQPDAIIPCMMRAGVNYVWPFEVAAGCDVNDLRRRYPTLGMMGGIDKRALARGPEAIDEELARIRPAVEAGRYVPELDHGIPNDVSWQDFCYYAEALKKLVAKTQQ